jgi:4-diphosphocytidyl-2-C-methyl-D-erythritol kinase
MGGGGARRSLPLRVPAHAKINLGLEVLGVREDGYHELRTLFQTVSLADRLQLVPTADGSCELSCDDPRVPGDESNLALRAALDLRRYAREARGVRIHIEKRIPVAGGLGGGSSDAAAVLMGLDALWGLHLGVDGLLPLARRLGADVPFFLFGGTALGIARGDEIYPLAQQLRLGVVIVDPGRPLSTRAVFGRLDAGLTRRENSNNIFRFLSRSVDGVADAVSLLANDLEGAALEEEPDLVPRIERIRRLLRREGAVLTSLSGSGSSYFGLFDRAPAAAKAAKAIGAAGFRALRCRTLGAQEYRRVWKRALGGRQGRARVG